LSKCLKKKNKGAFVVQAFNCFTILQTDILVKTL